MTSPARLEPGWWVRLDGDAFDLDALREHMRGPDVRVVQHGEAHYLRAADFAGFGADEAGDVYRRAVELVDVLNAAAALVDTDYRPVTVGGTVRAAEDGSLHTTMFASSALVIVTGMRARLTVEGREKEEPTGPSAVERIASRAMDDGKARQALRILAREDVDYRDLYFVLELIEAARKGAIYGEGWATRREVERFTHTANSPSVLGDAARHATEQTPPRNPMTFEEARALIRRLLTAWLSR